MFARFLKSPWAIPEAIPVVAVACAGSTLGVGAIYVTLTQHNDVTINKRHQKQWESTPQKDRYVSYESTAKWYEAHGAEMPKERIAGGTKPLHL